MLCDIRESVRQQHAVSVLRVKNGIALEAKSGGRGAAGSRREAFFEPGTDSEVKIDPALAARMGYSSLVDRLVNMKMVPDQFRASSGAKGMLRHRRCCADGPATNPAEVGAALPAFAVIIGRRFSGEP